MFSRVRQLDIERNGLELGLVGKDSDEVVFSVTAVGCSSSSRAMHNFGVLFPMPLLERVSLFHVNDKNTSIVTLTDFLARHPSITNILFSHCSEEIIQVLSITQTRRLCPLLKDLSLSSCELTRATLFDIVQSRTKCHNEDGTYYGDVARLQRLDISSCFGITNDTIMALGKHLEVVSGTDPA